MSAAPTVEVSWGELVDKLTILEIKERRLSSPAAVETCGASSRALNKVLSALTAAARLRRA